MYQDKKHKIVTENKTAQLQKGKGTILSDNRPESIVQQKRIDAIQNTTVQKKKNNTGLPDNLKSGIENMSGISMDDVKVHYNSNKPAQLNAHAYAQGTNIHVASGQEKHLAHEAWHIVQQKQGRVKPTMKTNGVAVNDDKGLEKEADTMGDKALQMKKSNEALILKNSAINNETVQQVSKPIAATVGGIIGGAFGMLGGPVGMGVGALAGAGIGAYFGGDAQPQNGQQQVVQAPQNQNAQQPPVQAPVNLRPQINNDLLNINQRSIQIRALLPQGFWAYQGNEAYIKDHYDIIRTYIQNDNHRVIQNDQTALARVTQLNTDSNTTLHWFQTNHEKLNLIDDLYKKYVPLPGGIPTLLNVWNAVLGGQTPDGNLFNQYYAIIKDAFTTHAKTGFNAAPDKENRFVHLMKMGSISVGTKGKGKGVNGVYESEFDARRGAFGVEWEVNGLDGWLLHGHGVLHDDKNSFDLHRIHIKHSSQAMALGASTVINDNQVKQSVIASSKSHVSKLAKNRRYEHIFKINKEKIRSHRGAIY